MLHRVRDAPAGGLDRLSAGRYHELAPRLLDHLLDLGKRGILRSAVDHHMKSGPRPFDRLQGGPQVVIRDSDGSVARCRRFRPGGPLGHRSDQADSFLRAAAREEGQQDAAARPGLQPTGGYQERFCERRRVRFRGAVQIGQPLDEQSVIV